MGLAAGLYRCIYREGGLPLQEVFLYTGRVVGTCALFYGLFLGRALGAGDVKLMAVCTGILGFWDGLLTIFFGLGLAGIRAVWMMARCGGAGERLKRLFLYAACVIQGVAGEYPQNRDPGHVIRLGPYLFLGYCLFLGYRRFL